MHYVHENTTKLTRQHVGISFFKFFFVCTEQNRRTFKNKDRQKKKRINDVNKHETKHNSGEWSKPSLTI